MNKKPKSFSLIIIVLSAIVLFITAIVMNKLSPDNSEKISVSNIQVTSESSQSKPSINDHNTPIKPIEQQPVLFQPEDIPLPGSNAKSAPSEEQKVASRAKLERKLNMSLMLNTPEKIITAIEALKKQGREDEANEYIEFLLTTFPEYDYQ